MTYQKNKRFVLTSRTNIIEKSIYYSTDFSEYHINDIAIPLVSVDLNDEIKSKILYNHLWHSQLDDEIIKEIVQRKIYREIINHRNFNPRIIEFITETKNYEKSEDDYISFVKKSLDNPTEIWNKCFTGQLNESQRILIKLVVANGGQIEEKYLSEAYSKAKNIFQLYGPSIERNDYKYVLEICEKSLLKIYRREKNIFTMKVEEDKTLMVSTFNPSVNDFGIPLINNSDELEKMFNCLHSIECMRVICSLKYDKKVKLLKKILDSSEKFDNIKICALRELTKLDVNCAKMYLYQVIAEESVSLNNIDDIVIDTIDEIDYSDFLKKHVSEYECGIDEAYELYDGYCESRYCKKDVLNLIYKAIVHNIEYYLDDLMHDNEEFIKCVELKDGYNCLENILSEFKYLEKEDKRKIITSVNMEQEIEDNRERLLEEDYKYHENDYNERMRSDQSFDKDMLFNGLLKR